MHLRQRGHDLLLVCFLMISKFYVFVLLYVNLFYDLILTDGDKVSHPTLCRLDHFGHVLSASLLVLRSCVAVSLWLSDDALLCLDFCWWLCTVQRCAWSGTVLWNGAGLLEWNIRP